MKLVFISFFLFVLTASGMKAPLSSHLTDTPMWSRKDSLAGVAQWKEFRKNETQHKGTKIKWRMMIFGADPNDLTFGQLSPPHTNHDCGLFTAEHNTGSKAFFSEGYPKLHRFDWVIVSGEFIGVNPEGICMIICDKIVNEGPADE
jgi:hypothetical protein